MGPDTNATNWVFLGDSLTEGVGSQRVSHVSELVARLRSNRTKPGSGWAIHHMRLRSVDPTGFDPFVKFNVAGFLDTEEQQDPSLWIWNLACEGQTIEEDFDWLPFVTNLRPDCIVIFRGSLESIIRPAMIKDGAWPWWVPESWRNYPTMDPRCYFSSRRWRRAKQSSLDKLKQIARLKLLDMRPGQPLMHDDALLTNYTELLTQLRSIAPRVVVLGLLPVDQQTFPGSSEYFARVNDRLKQLTKELDVEFVDWGSALNALEGRKKLFYRDGFHPNSNGSKVLAEILRGHLGDVVG